MMLTAENNNATVDTFESRRTQLLMDAERRSYTSIAIAQAACILHEAGHSMSRASMLATALHLLGQRFHRHFERECSDADYESRATGMEQKLNRDLSALDVARVYNPVTGNDTFAPIRVTLQSDPRGWPIILTFKDREVRLGGRDT